MDPLHLRSAGTSLVISFDSGEAEVIHWGADLGSTLPDLGHPRPPRRAFRRRRPRPRRRSSRRPPPAGAAAPPCAATGSPTAFPASTSPSRLRVT